jgi:hypothetical protein
MVKTGSVTHSFNMDQRFLELDFEQVDDQLTTNLPMSPNLETPGSYMLFFIDNFSVPSQASFIAILPDADTGGGPNTDNTGAMRYSAVGQQGTTTQTISLNENSNYSISVDLKVASCSSGRSVFDTSDRFDSDCQKTTKAGGWETHTCTFNSGSLSDLKIRLFAIKSFSGSAYFDNIVVTAEGSSTNLIINGDFENGTDG